MTVWQELREQRKFLDLIATPSVLEGGHLPLDPHDVRRFLALLGTETRDLIAGGSTEAVYPPVDFARLSEAPDSCRKLISQRLTELLNLAGQLSGNRLERKEDFRLLLDYLTAGVRSATSLAATMQAYNEYSKAEQLYRAGELLGVDDVTSERVLNEIASRAAAIDLCLLQGQADAPSLDEQLQERCEYLLACSLVRPLSPKEQSFLDLAEIGISLSRLGQGHCYLEKDTPILSYQKLASLACESVLRWLQEINRAFVRTSQIELPQEACAERVVEFLDGNRHLFLDRLEGRDKSRSYYESNIYLYASAVIIDRFLYANYPGRRKLSESRLHPTLALLCHSYTESANRTFQIALRCFRLASQRALEKRHGGVTFRGVMQQVDQIQKFIQTTDWIDCKRLTFATELPFQPFDSIKPESFDCDLYRIFREVAIESNNIESNNADFLQASYCEVEKQLNDHLLKLLAEEGDLRRLHGILSALGELSADCPENLVALLCFAFGSSERTTKVIAARSVLRAGAGRSGKRLLIQALNKGGQDGFVLPEKLIDHLYFGSEGLVSLEPSPAADRWFAEGLSLVRRVLPEGYCRALANPLSRIASRTLWSH